MKIAAWSGPRNLSTAMMYSFGNRSDCAITDEPFYAAYLAKTGIVHPMNAEILASQDQDPNQVISQCSDLIPNDNTIWYQKHMTHHMLPSFSLDWLAGFTNVFLIRNPARVIASYSRKRENPTLDDLGFVQQKRIYDHCIALNQDPIVIDSDYILADPRSALSILCEKIEIPFDPAMLHWCVGPRSEDGVWAKHWYDAVHRSTGFGPPAPELPKLSNDMKKEFATAFGIYEDLAAIALP